MKTWTIRVNCPGYKDIEVVADSEEEAISMAEKEYQCDHVGGEFCEILEVINNKSL